MNGFRKHVGGNPNGYACKNCEQDVQSAAKKAIRNAHNLWY
jgi:hypothetical protein